jgi:iron-sulfur cluster repair protein YtfE (RIC family)
LKALPGMADPNLDLDLDRRTGWPDDLRLLVERYPREAWPGHPNLGRTARFWLERHDMFRGLGGALERATGEFREGRVALPAFRSWFAPRLGFFLSQLHAHHQVEDVSYFPLLRAAEPGLGRGFAVLERDHEVIHETLARLAEAANAFLKAQDPDRLRFLADAYARVTDELLSGLVRHLADEEDLIIPLILDRGEDELGVG